MRSEVQRQARRLRTRLALAAMVTVPLLILAAFEIGGTPGQRDNEPPGYDQLANQSGINFALFVLLMSAEFLLVIVVALFAGDSVASEASWGSLRYLLSMPIARGRLLRIKITVAAIYGLVAILLLTTSALVMGVAAYGWHDLHTPGGSILTPWHAVGLMYLATAYLFTVLFTVATLAFLLSTTTDAPLGAVGSAVLIFLVSQILDQVTSLGSARDVLPTHYLGAWTDLFAQPIDATHLGWGVLQAVAWSTALLSASWWWFQHKDITS